MEDRIEDKPAFNLVGVTGRVPMHFRALTMRL